MLGNNRSKSLCAYCVNPVRQAGFWSGHSEKCVRPTKYQLSDRKAIVWPVTYLCLVLCILYECSMINI